MVALLIVVVMRFINAFYAIYTSYLTKTSCFGVKEIV